MRLQGRNLRAGMAGEDVAALHSELVELGYQIPDTERTDAIFGVATAGAVAHFQKANGLWDTAVVDANTAAMLGRVVNEAAAETIVVMRAVDPDRPAARPVPPKVADPDETAIRMIPPKAVDPDETMTRFIPPKTTDPATAQPPASAQPPTPAQPPATAGPATAAPPSLVPPPQAGPPTEAAPAAGVSTEDVALLHRALLAIGIDISDAELDGRRFGPTTREAVARLQVLVGIEPTGQVDKATLAMARAALDRIEAHRRQVGEQPGGRVAPVEDAVVEGTVSDLNGLPMAGVTVIAALREMRGSTEIGRGETGKGGRYRIAYQVGTAAPGLEFSVVDATGRVLFRSAVHHQVERQAEIPLALGGPARTVPSELSFVGIEVGRRLGQLRPEELTEDERHQDLTFLADDTGLAKPSIAFYSAAARLASSTDLPPELFYGLFRQNVPADAAVSVLASTAAGTDLDKNSERLLQSILTASPEVRSRAIATAIDDGIVPPDYARRAEGDLARLSRLAVTAALTVTQGMGKTPISAVLAAAAIPQDKQEKFISLYASAGSPSRTFWRDLAKNPEFTKQDVSALKFVTTVGHFTRGHLPLVNALLEMKRQGRVKGTRDLARLTASDWKEILRGQGEGGPVGVPANFTAQDQDHAVEAYAFLLERRFERLHPTTAFSARLAADEASPFLAKEAVASFLDSNPGFSLTRTNIDRYLKDNPQAVVGTDRAVVRESLLTGQRLLKLTSRYAVSAPLLADRIHSAQQIYSLGKTQFVATYQDHPEIGAAQAARVYAMAEQTYAMALAVTMKFHAPIVGVNPSAIAPAAPAPAPSAPPGPAPSQPTVSPPAPSPPAPSPSSVAPLDDFPNLATLFGSLDLCSCAHCRSVLSPAAYLADMLHFLAARKTNGTSAKDVLLARRPDLAQIELSCPNTNTVLPYIDLVNELLEDAVAPPADPVAAARARQTTLTTDELNANPEHVNAAAYAELGQAVFPWVLPFHLPLQEARTYLGMLGTDRVALMRAFQGPPEVGSAHSIAMAVDGLGLSSVEADLITGGPAAAGKDPWELWGLAENGNTVPDPVDHTVAFSGTWLDVLSHLPILLDRSGLAYETLSQLLNTVFVNPDGTVTVQCHPADSCDLGAMTVDGLTPDVLDRLHRFVRLLRRLGWDVYQVDSAVALLQSGTPNGVARLNTTLLRQLFAVRTAMTRFRLPVAAAVALLARIDTRTVPALPGEEHARPPLYLDLFANRAVLNPVDAIFALDADGTEIAAIGSNPTLAKHRAALVAAFELTDDDLMLAIAAVTNGALNVANLSTLYRHVLLARGLGLSIRDLLSLRALVEREIDVAPFHQPVDPFDAARPELLGAFCDEVDRVRRTRFSVTELDYLLRHVHDATSGVAPDDIAVGTLLKSVRDKLLKAAAESSGNVDPTGLVVQELADALGLPTATVAELVTVWLSSQTDSSKPLIDEFLALPKVARDPSTQDNPVSRGEAGFAVYFTEYAALAKAALVISGFGFTTEETTWLREHGVPEGWLDPTGLPLAPATSAEGRYARWRRLAEAAMVKAALPSDGTPFTALLDLARTGASKATYLDALGRRTQWPAQSLAVLAGDPGNPADGGLLALAYPDDLRSERGLARLVPAFGQLRRLGTSADVSGWLGATVTATQAEAIKASVKAKYSTQRWAAVAKPLRDVLREQQRDALVGYLLAHPPNGVKRWHDPSDVYARYLIDVEMSSCQGASRMVQANATVQLFVQRCVLNLEPAVTVDADVDDDWPQWRWMSRYRVWEANRKVFLYPENWIEPALRREKSPFFKDLENELLQGEVTRDTAEEAFRGYLEKLEAVARLDVVGVFHEPGPPTALHVIGRKPGNPPVHYHRTWLDSSRWTAWTRIDLDIMSDHVLPVVWNRRLYLFWTVVSRKPDRTQQNPPMQLANSVPGPAKTHLEVQLAWSERRGEKWLPTQTAPQVIVFSSNVDAHEVTLKSSINDPLLRIDLFAEHEHFAEFVLGGVGNAVEAFAVSTSSLGALGPESRGIGTLANALQKGTLTLPTNSAYEGNTIVPVSQTQLTPYRQRVSACYTTYDSYGALSSEVVLDRADRYRLVVPHQTLRFDSSLPFFFADSMRSYFCTATVYYKNGNYFTTTAPNYVYRPFYKAKYAFEPFYHAFVPLLLRELVAGGVDRLFRRQLQLNPAIVADIPAFGFKPYYQPTDNVLKPYPTEGIDFGPNAGYSVYNWELFFHAPMQIGQALHRNQRFEEAKHWYEYIFNPTSATKDPVPQRYWVTKPFFQTTSADYHAQAIETLMKLVNERDPALEHQVALWRANPFDPHIIAALRPVAYQRAIVMKYIDNLVAWGDQLFRQDTMESVNEATQLYVLAAELLGPKPQIVPRQDTAAPMTYADIEASLDDFTNAVAAAENVVPPVKVNVPVDPDTPKLPMLPALYFCIPPNEQLMRCWDTVADRLFKVRHCMNIEGVLRQLALFAPPIDPGMLVKAVAAGLDLGSVLNDTSAALPPYRFRVILREAVELAEHVRVLGADLLSCLERRDADRLDRLRSGAERKLADQVRAVQRKTVEEAEQQIEVLDKVKLVVGERQKYFHGLTESLTNTWEAAAMVLTAASVVAQGFAIALDTASGASHVAPDAQFGGSGAGGSPHATVKYGGENVGKASAAWAKVAKIAAAVLQTGAQLSTVTGQYQRRQEEWEFQDLLAGKELDQLDAQLVGARIRAEIAAKTRDNHEIVADAAAGIDEFLHDRFTNRELYEWMIAQTSATYFQAYQLAFTVAKRAEQCFRHELGLRDSSFVQFGYWDSLKKGLLSADKLLHDLRRMEAAYFAQHSRELELTKNVSLLTLDPYALVQLRSTGQCTVRVPELLFDLDNPGHYHRRCKSVAVTVPCVVGPYTGVPLTLTLLDNHTRTTTEVSGQYERLPGDDPRFVDDPGGVAAMVTSQAQNDSGLFEPRLDDERYLPFEGAGAIGTWQIRLNPVYPQFDHRTISDVVLHLRYTARDGGATLAAAADSAVRAQLNAVALAESRKGLYRLVSASQEDATAWYKFLHPAGEQDQVLVVDTPPDRFPFFTDGLDIKVVGIDVLAKLTDPGDHTLVVTRPGAGAQAVTMQADSGLGGLHHFAADPLAPKSPLGRAPATKPHPQWTFKLQKFGAADFRSLTADEIEDLVIIFRYEVTP